MQIVKAKMGVLTVSITKQLESLPISDTKALFVELEQVANVRSMIWTLKKNTNLRFKTKKADAGMNVWRLPDHTPEHQVVNI